MKVYLYACLDGEGWAHSGLTTGSNRREVTNDIIHNFKAVSHIMVEYVPELRPVFDETETHLIRFERVAADVPPRGPHNYIGEEAVGCPFDEPTPTKAQRGEAE